jgi:Flp pilus assembly protein TadD
MSEKAIEKLCANCQTALDPDLRFCRSCGAPVQNSPAGAVSQPLDKGDASAVNSETKPAGESSQLPKTEQLSPKQVAAGKLPAVGAASRVNGKEKSVNANPAPKGKRANSGIRYLILFGLLSAQFVVITGGGLLAYRLIRPREANAEVAPVTAPPPVAAPANNVDTGALLTDAKNDLQAGRAVEAIEKLDRLIQLDSNNAEPYKLRGNALLLTNRFAEAVESYKQAIAHNGGDLEVYQGLGESYERQEQFDSAVEAYSSALAIKSDDAKIHLQMARALVRLNRIEDARKNYEQAINGGDAELTAAAKQELAKIGEPRNTASVKPKPDVKPVDNGAATPPPVQAPPVEAPKPEPVETPKPTPKPVEPVVTAAQHISKGIAFFNSGDSSSAMREFQAAQRQEPGNADVFYLMGQVHEKGGDLESALKDYERCTSGTYANVARGHVKMLKDKVEKMHKK